jgi:two-component system chemotaxis sensor kinase CheA
MMDAHIKAFVEEATEMLAELEVSLLKLENNAEDKELLAKVFRALHTIKGSAGMFGFDDITAFTHDIETVFDYIRNGDIKITKEIIDLTLASRDQISLMLQSSENNRLFDQRIIEHILDSFRNISAEYNSNKNNCDPKTGLEQIPDELPNGSLHSYLIKFKPGPDIFLNGVNPILLLNELRELGECNLISGIDDIPALENIDPEKCYTSWEMTLLTDKGLNAIKDVFIFVEDECELEIKIMDADEEPVLSDQPKPESNKSKENVEIRHEAETVSSIRVNAEKLDELVNLVGELVITQARLRQIALKFNDNDITSVSEEVERIAWSLRDSALNIRMLPIGTTFSRFIRLVRDLSNNLGKAVELTTSGAETELDKTVIENLNDPLVHIIRNCIDHGIETPEERIKAGKPETGNIHLAATQAGGNVLITITDDGAGMDKAAIKAKAIEKRLVPENCELTDSEIYALVLAPGFSTAKTITNISGRGVGMDVVKRAIDNLRGTIEISSHHGKGTSITLKLPLTLAIIDGLLVGIGDDHYVLPLSTIEECVELSEKDINNAHGRNLVNIRGNIVPYISLRERFEINSTRPDIEQIVVANINGGRIGFVVDNVFGQHQTVLKTLGRYYRDVEGVSGATILGDGTVALILDIRKLVEKQEIAENKFLFGNKA